MICTLEPTGNEGGKSAHVTVPDIPNPGEVTGEGEGSNKRYSFADDVQVPSQTIADCGRHLDYYEKQRLRVGIIIHTTQTHHRSLAALSNPASSCKVTALAVLHPPPSFSIGSLDQLSENEYIGHLTPGSIMRRWMERNNLGNHSERVAVFGGEEGARQIVQRKDVDAVFVIVPDEIHNRYALSALEHEKHVLLSDPVSVSMSAFQEQLQYAQRYGKFVQTCTAFMHQYRVRKFMDAVLHEERFGQVRSIEAQLSLCPKDFHRVGVNEYPLPLGKNQGCIRRLGRYCALFSIVLFMKLGCHPISCQVQSADVGKSQNEDEAEERADRRKAEPLKARGTVKYSGDRELTFNVDYSTASATRQNLEVKTDANSLATMSDFVFPHPDGLATYRIYEKVGRSNVSDDIQLLNGEAVDIAGGPNHDVIMWRTFVELCQSVDVEGWNDSSAMERVRELEEITYYTKTVLNALMQSFEEGFTEVAVKPR